MIPFFKRPALVKRLSWRLLASAVLIGLVLYAVPLHQIAGAIGAFDLAWIIPIIALHLVGVSIRSWKLHYLSSASGVPIPFRSVVRLYFVGNLAYVFVPSLEVVQVGLLGSEEGRYTRAALTVAIDRLSGVTALFAIGTAAIYFTPEVSATIHPIIRTIVIVLFGILLLSFLAGFSARLRIALWRCVPLATREGTSAISRSLRALNDGVRLLGERKSRIPALLVLSVLFQSVGLGIYCLMTRAMGLEIAPQALATVFPLMGLSNLIPSFLGIGSRDLGFILALQQVGIQASDAVALSLLHLGLILYSAAIGALFLTSRGMNLSPQRDSE